MSGLLESQEANMLRAGAARRDITPRLPFDLQPNLRGVEAATIHSPLEARACVLETDEAALVILTGDLLGTSVQFASQIREAVAAAVGCTPSHVLVNFSHTHAAPAPDWPYKIGSAYTALDHTADERSYYHTLPGQFAAAAADALAQAKPAVVSGGVGRAPGIAVNRRERTPDGRTILGWNRQGFVDDDVPVIAIDDLAGNSIATIVGFGCHPVVLGCRCGDAAYASQPAHFFQLSSDFIGPLRSGVEGWRGGLCLFLQGAAGNVLPLETFNDVAGTEQGFGRRLALEALHATADSPALQMDIERLQDDHLAFVDFSLYRRRPRNAQPAQRLSVVSHRVAWPLLSVPELDALRHEEKERTTILDQLLSQAAPSGMAVNQQRYHLAWLRKTIASVEAGTVADAVEGEVWAARIGNYAIAAVPAEIFSETGYAVRSNSPAEVTIFAGCSNGILGYAPTRDEYPYGGYEPAIAHRGYGQPAPFDPDVAEMVERDASAALKALFG
jgi:hypothetical protein